ncbi:T9SS type A sorting domain-containing protein [Aequorivita marina]|uniref:T9SS type A sorting domain-containing protein n=1 Tax=Aequorivita marina TaxID=3073654 RepID=UPI0028766BFB|nr:T9SS type A sorting domain-containing protein [Aequorivita sp. S2608]MDS1299517.1 T9SS type A sorting domain-containing protein [Aequorivita sp. S2608]
MKKITLLTVLLIGAASFSQIAGTSFEEPETFSGKYTDTGDPNVAHSLINNVDEPLVNYTLIDQELGFLASYEPYDTPSNGSTDGDYVGVTKTKPSSDVFYTDGSNGYRMNDTDGNYILEFDPVDLTGVLNPAVSLDFLLSINSNPENGNYEGDGSINESGHDRLRIYTKDLTNNTEIDLFDSTGTDLDEFVPFDAASGEYKLEWQNATATLLPNTIVQLVITGRNNASSESFWFDNILFDGLVNVQEQAKADYNIYPNPTTNGYIHITSSITGAKKITIYDVLGKQVFWALLNGEKLDISHLNSGVYILKIIQEEVTATKKLIVQ